MFILITILVVIFDQATKALVRSHMQVGESIPLIPSVLHISYIKNSGAAFGLFPNKQPLFLIAAIAVIIFIVYYYSKFKSKNKLLKVGLSLVLGGALGNFIDRLFIGSVTDFIDIRIWPVFNIADTSVVIGAIFLIIILFESSREEQVPQG